MGGAHACRPYIYTPRLCLPSGYTTNRRKTDVILSTRVYTLISMYHHKWVMLLHLRSSLCTCCHPNTNSNNTNIVVLNTFR